MMKRCTQSSCRRVFDAALHTACPFCGKAYPRLHNVSGVHLLDTGSGRIHVIYTLFKLIHMNPKEASALTKSTPCWVGAQLSYAQKHQLVLALRAVGANVRYR